MKKRTARLITVPNCALCPFSHAPDDGDDWTCMAIEDANGHYRVIKPPLQKRRGGPWLPPPSWCPLRSEIIVVALEDGR